PGLGQLYNKQIFKALIFFAVLVIFIVEMVVYGAGAMEGLITLGTTPREDHSLFLLIEGALQILVLIVFALIYFINIYDARRVAQLRSLDANNVNYTVKSILNN